MNDDRLAMLDLMMRAYLLMLGSGLRSYERGMQLYAEHSPRLTNEPNQSAAIDELRGWMREMADLQSQESRLFVQQLDELLRQTLSASDEDVGETWKRWQVKP